MIEPTWKITRVGTRDIDDRKDVIVSLHWEYSGHIDGVFVSECGLVHVPYDPDAPFTNVAKLDEKTLLGWVNEQAAREANERSETRLTHLLKELPPEEHEAARAEFAVATEEVTPKSFVQSTLDAAAASAADRAAPLTGLEKIAQPAVAKVSAKK